jgi:bifunctional ADP-heptose synthase (sugar kinase/adenylyltransferase)
VGTLPHVRRDNILVFGMVEYVPCVHGNRVVYDPQSNQPKTFSSSGSTANELIYVLNELELERITNLTNLKEAADKLLSDEKAVAIVVKRGPRGAAIFTRDEHTVFIPCYRARRVFKIGSGDMFAAAFAYFWQMGNERIAEAADLASRAVACYAETQDASIPSKEELLKGYNEPVEGRPGSVYLAAPFFSLEQRWILEETKLILENFGCDVFSPFHAVGTGLTNAQLAEEDLKGLVNCDAILGLINDNDTGTIFEIGFGSATKKKTVLYAERNSPRDFTMLDGTGCLIFPDYSSAVYNAVWESFK